LSSAELGTSCEAELLERRRPHPTVVAIIVIDVRPVPTVVALQELGLLVDPVACVKVLLDVIRPHAVMPGPHVARIAAGRPPGHLMPAVAARVVRVRRLLGCFCLGTLS